MEYRYDPILCMNVPVEKSKAKDADKYVEKAIELLKQGKTKNEVIFALQRMGLTPIDASQKLGKALVETGFKYNDSASSVDKAIKACDEDEKWITIKGSHVKIDGDGNIVEGNSQLKEKLKGKNNKSKESESKNKNDKKSENKTSSKFDEKQMKMLGEALYNSGVSRNVNTGISQLMDVDEDDKKSINKALEKIQSYASENGKKATMRSILSAVDRFQDELDGATYYRGKIKEDDERWNKNKEKVMNKIGEKLEKYGLKGLKLNEKESKSQGGGHYSVTMNFNPKRVGGGISKSSKVVMNVKLSNRYGSAYVSVDEFKE